MFICEKCLKENFKNWAMPVSYGKCEFCEEVKDCCDVKSGNLIEKYKSEEDY